MITHEYTPFLAQYGIGPDGEPAKSLAQTHRLLKPIFDTCEQGRQKAEKAMAERMQIAKFCADWQAQHGGVLTPKKASEMFGISRAHAIQILMLAESEFGVKISIQARKTRRDSHNGK